MANQHANSKIEKAFLECYEKYAEAILRHCTFRVYDRERGLEIMQEAFLKTWKQITNGAEIVNIRAFVYRVANNLIIDESRKKKSVSLNELQEAGFDPASSVDHSTEVAMRIDAAEALKVLDQLDEKYREVLILRYVDGFSPREIASIIGETANVISVRIHRAIQQVKNILHKS